MRIILYLLEYIHGYNPRSIRDRVEIKIKIYIYHGKKGRNILEKVEKIPKKVISVGIVATATVVLGRNSGVWVLYIG
jgi:hypothetical protein